MRCYASGIALPNKQEITIKLIFMTQSTAIEQGIATATAKPVTAISYKAANISLISTGGFLVLLTALHFIKPEINPSWRFISEYAIGSNGWMMILSFLVFATSYSSLFIAIRSQIQRTTFGRTGLSLLLISAAGLAIAGVFITDPITAGENERTMSGNLHSTGGVLGMAMPFAAFFICISLRKNKNWASAKRPILWATIIALLGFLVSFVSLGVMLSQSGGKFGPDVLVGWPNRFEVVAYCIWLFVVAKQAKRLSSQNP